MIHNVIIFLALGVFLAACQLKLDDNDLVIDGNYPRWLKTGSYSSSQTSGITFIGYDNRHIKTFLIADDVGKIHHLRITGEDSIHLSPVNFSGNVVSFLNAFPKKDFEDIVFDKYTASVLLSIEGNYPGAKEYAGIYILDFKDNNIFSDSIVSIKKLEISPRETFVKYVEDNIGYEGIAADENFYYLGLEGFSDNEIFSDNTFIFIVDKKTKRIIKEINTKKLGISTICGLYSKNNYSLYGVDRNSKSFFYLDFFDDLDIKSSGTKPIKTHIPGYKDLNYVASLESITMDDEKNIYMVDDPWRKFFVPSKNVLNKLDGETKDNFKKYIPIIYKFKYN